MNFDKKINETASRLGMVPGDSRRWDYDRMVIKSNPLCPVDVENFIINCLTLKEGKSGKTRLRFYGIVNYSDGRGIHREIVPWEIDSNAFLEILDNLN